MDPFESLKTFVCDDDTDHTPMIDTVDAEMCRIAGSLGGRTTKDEQLGIFHPEYDRTPMAKYAGRKGARTQIENKIGIWAMTPEQQSERSKRCGKTTTSQRWKCLITGHISTPGGLSNYQKGLGIDYKDKSLRIKVSNL